MRIEFRNNIKIIPDYAKHVRCGGNMVQPANQSWAKTIILLFTSTTTDLECSISLQRSSTLTSDEQDHNSHLGMHGMLCGIFMFLWDTNSLRDNLQPATDVENTRGPGKS